ncbi:acylphosphatase [Dyella sp.]|uniref:acylphosphatase n=1 Tax=Dyella sp. TaxID=1869338 RepID=UPI002ED4C0D2
MAGARFIVHGRVQGVLYRACTREQALALGMRGHAKNMADGGVEVLAFGDEAALDAFERWLWQGSPSARVDDVTREPAIDGGLGDFMIY